MPETQPLKRKGAPPRGEGRPCKIGLKISRKAYDAIKAQPEGTAATVLEEWANQNSDAHLRGIIKEIVAEKMKAKGADDGTALHPAP